VITRARRSVKKMRCLDNTAAPKSEKPNLFDPALRLAFGEEPSRKTFLNMIFF
jgi:hypothetical protein